MNPGSTRSRTTRDGRSCRASPSAFLGRSAADEDDNRGSARVIGTRARCPSARRPRRKRGRSSPVQSSLLLRDVAWRETLYWGHCTNMRGPQRNGKRTRTTSGVTVLVSVRGTVQTRQRRGAASMLGRSSPIRNGPTPEADREERRATCDGHIGLSGSGDGDRVVPERQAGGDRGRERTPRPVRATGVDATVCELHQRAIVACRPSGGPVR